MVINNKNSSLHRVAWEAYRINDLIIAVVANNNLTCYLSSNVTEASKSPFESAPLEKYTLKDRLVIRFADLAFFALINVLAWTVRFEIYGWEHFESIENANKIPIYIFWHDRILLGTYFFRNKQIVVLTSQSKDGEYIARFIQRFGYGTIRGSSTRGGARGLVEMIRAMRAGSPMAFSVDGPKGPRYVAKPGPVLLAKKTGNPMIPFVFEPRKYWAAASWDKLQIPRPFTKVALFIEAPIYVSSEADDVEVESKLAELQGALDRLVDRGSRWRLGR
jgi:lysophospholipid acyltransferase (LPLAT)-like uncharacterized protein